MLGIRHPDPRRDREAPDRAPSPDTPPPPSDSDAPPRLSDADLAGIHRKVHERSEAHRRWIDDELDPDDADGVCRGID